VSQQKVARESVCGFYAAELSAQNFFRPRGVRGWGLSRALLSIISAIFFSVAYGSIRFRGRLLFLDFLGFCFVRPAQALSTPQLLAPDRCAVAQGAQLGPGDLRMEAAA
jgi:hypothetical protein